MFTKYNIRLNPRLIMPFYVCLGYPNVYNALAATKETFIQKKTSNVCLEGLDKTFMYTTA